MKLRDAQNRPFSTPVSRGAEERAPSGCREPFSQPCSAVGRRFHAIRPARTSHQLSSNSLTLLPTERGVEKVVLLDGAATAEEVEKRIESLLH